MTGTSTPRLGRAHRALPLLATTVLTAVGVALVTWPLPRVMGNATLQAGDTLLAAWQLNAFHHSLLVEPRAWADANIFFPFDRAATFNDLLLAHAVVTLPAAWSASPVLAVNLALLGGIVLCGVFAHLLVDELVDTPWAAVAGGVLFALAPFRVLHLGHLSVAAAWAVPLFLWALLRHLRAPSWGRAALTAAAGVTVCTSSLYLAAFVAPLVPVVALLGARRGPGGRRTWLPLVVAGVPALAFVAVLLAPYAETMRTFGVASAPHDLARYGADLSSLAQKPGFLDEDASASRLNPEAHLYPGAALAVLSVVGLLVAADSWRRVNGGQRPVGLALVALAGLSVVGLLVPMRGLAGDLWKTAVLAVIWLGPPATIAAVARRTRPGDRGPLIAAGIGVAGASLSFVLSLGPTARHVGRVIGPAPYALLAASSQVFEGTRVPARFGGLLILFLALLAAAALAALLRARTAWARRAGACAVVAALGGCLAELPAAPLPEGRPLVELPALEDPVYRFLAERSGRFGVLELPDWPAEAKVDYWHREWRALRHMLASKQHGKHLVNGAGRVEPAMWQHFRGLEPWSDEFFAFIAACFPVDYVLVHEGGIPDAQRDAVWARLASGVDGWKEVFHSPRVRVFSIDRSFGRAPSIDRLLLRKDLAPSADVAFSARLARPPSDADATAGEGATLELLRDSVLIASWPIDAGWREYRATVEVAPVPAAPSALWPSGGTLLRWRVREPGRPPFELRGLAVNRATRPAASRAPAAQRTQIPDREARGARQQIGPVGGHGLDREPDAPAAQEEPEQPRVEDHHEEQ
jgi:hypothetical protein